MRTRDILLCLSVFVGALCVATNSSAQAPSTACTGPNGSRFNLEPRTKAVIQAAQSVAFLPSAGQSGDDLVVATATDMRSIAGSSDEFYVQRSNANCSAELEGGLPFISNIIDQFAPFGTPTAIADPARNAFFIADLRFGLGTDDSGVGVVRANASGLLNSTLCPSGTQTNGSAGCFNSAAVFNIASLNSFQFNPHIAVDARTSGTGAGDLYAVVTQADPNDTLHRSIFLTACTNGLNCGNSIKISGADLEGDFAWVQVRPDGVITITYRNTTFPGINPEDIKFITCTPNGAPKAPTCKAPILITTENTPIFASLAGDVPMQDQLYPRHANRLESDGVSVTTFVVYDRCAVPVIDLGFAVDFCPKTDVVMTSSADGGNSWSPITKLSNSKGQQFFVQVAIDVSTETLNIAYYSTENDPLQQRAQVFLTQVQPGTTTVGKAQLLTTAFADAAAESPVQVLFSPGGFGDRLGLAAGGTGTSGQSRAYVEFTWNSVFGSYAGVPMPDMNNHLAQFQY